jgi:hypothetical protein
MAKQNALLRFTGTLGNLVGYERKGEFFLRSKPQIVRQTPATRRAARRFGIASRKGAMIRHAFYDNLDIRCDSNHINRMNKVLIAAAGNNAAIVNFRFNQHTGVDRFFTLVPSISKDGSVHIPAQTLAQYKNVIALEVKVIAARIDFIAGQVTGTATAVMTMDTGQYFTGADISLTVPGAGTLLVTLQVRAIDKDGPSFNRQYQAADMIAVIAAQPAVVFNRHTHPQRTILGAPTLCKLPYTHIDQPVIQRE